MEFWGTLLPYRRLPLLAAANNGTGFVSAIGDFVVKTFTS